MIAKSGITVIIADDHPLMLKGLFEGLKNQGYQVHGQANNGIQALELILKYNPMIAILDIDMPLLNGFEVVKLAKERSLLTKFMVLSFHKEIDYLTQARNLNVDGYLLKEDSFQEIEEAIQTILNNKTYFSKSFEAELLENTSTELKKLMLLTPSEKTILKHIAAQKSSQEIAQSLFVSVRTIEKHRSNIIHKLDLDKETNTLTNWSLLHKGLIQDL